MRLLAIGDIHGNLAKLKKLIERVHLKPDDKLVLLGDYIDRGPDSKGVVDYLIRLKNLYPQTVFLRGNHEQMLLDALSEIGIISNWKPLRNYLRPDISVASDVDLFEVNGGTVTLESYLSDPNEEVEERFAAYLAIPDTHIAFFKETVLYYQWGTFLFVHASVNEQDPLGEKYGPYHLLWSRQLSVCQIDGQEMTIVHGHTPCRAPIFGERRINLDTGAGHGRALTCCNLLTHEIWQA